MKVSVDYREAVLLTMMNVFCRLMSQPADVNTQSSVGMFHFHDVLHCSHIEHIQLFYGHFSGFVSIHSIRKHLVIDRAVFVPTLNGKNYNKVIITIIIGLHFSSCIVSYPN